MRWEDYRKSDNVEDRRGEAGGGFSFPMGGRGGLGIGGLIAVGLLAWALGIDPRILIGGLEMLESGPAQYEQTRAPAPGKIGAPDDQLGRFVAATLAQTEDVWRQVFAAGGKSYEDPRLVLFSGGHGRRAGSPSRPWGRSIARPTSGSISTFPSSAISESASARRANSPPPT